jgi:hypothetical protein
MSLCPACGIDITAPICPHHHAIYDNWAEFNRIMCDFFHRGAIPQRLDAEERGDRFWADFTVA